MRNGSAISTSNQRSSTPHVISWWHAHTLSPLSYNFLFCVDWCYSWDGSVSDFLCEHDLILPKQHIVPALLIWRKVRSIVRFHHGDPEYLLLQARTNPPPTNLGIGHDSRLLLRFLTRRAPFDSLHGARAPLAPIPSALLLLIFLHYQGRQISFQPPPAIAFNGFRSGRATHVTLWHQYQLSSDHTKHGRFRGVEWDADECYRGREL